MNDKRLKIKFGSSVLSLLGVILIVLKLAKVISWSWWTVTAPFWVPLIVLLTVLFLVILFSLILTFLFNI